LPPYTSQLAGLWILPKSKNWISD